MYAACRRAGHAAVGGTFAGHACCGSTGTAPIRFHLRIRYAGGPAWFVFC